MEPTVAAKKAFDEDIHGKRGQKKLRWKDQVIKYVLILGGSKNILIYIKGRYFWG